MKMVHEALSGRSHTPFNPQEGRYLMRALQLATGITWTVMSFSPVAIAADVTGAEQRLAPFGEFIASIAGVQAVPQIDGAVASPSTLPALKSYLTGLYAGVNANAVKHSFVDANNTAFDCIPTSQQPALRGSTGPVLTAPDIPVMEGGTAAAGDKQNLITPLSPDNNDQLGNTMACSTGTIPMARVTPEQLARFPSLDAFFSKDGKNLHSGSTPAAQPSVADTHRWAHAYQVTNNLGGHSYINIWDPHIGANQIFSLSQHWYTGGSGSGLQTAEVGAQVYPQFYGTTNPVFFIYWTADAYNKTGCYNLTCSAFVQTNGSWALGGTLSPWSTPNGPQYEVEVSYYLDQGNWWLYVNGTTAAHAIGYYPAKIYNGGALSKSASEIDYGGEVDGTTSWPPMGGGAFANAGYGHAAYHRAIYYFPTTGGSTYASLTPVQEWPSDYTAVVTNYASPWYETLFFGGPGGTQ